MRTGREDGGRGYERGLRVLVTLANEFFSLSSPWETLFLTVINYLCPIF